MTDRDLASALAHHAARAAGRVPDGVRQASTEAVVDCLGVILGGLAEPAAAIARDLAAGQSSQGTASVLGTTRTTTPEWAALANGVAAHVLDFDDSHHPGMAHPTAVLLPAILAVAEEAHAPGRLVVEAHAVGLRVLAALGAAVNPEHYRRGWHATATLGTVAATAAVAVVLRLEPDRTAHALGIAASQSGGVRRNFGSMTKSLHAGWAAHSAVVACRLAGLGLTAGTQVLDGPGGWLDVMAGDSAARAGAVLAALEGDPEAAVAGLSLKRFASCGTTHTPLEAILALRAEEPFGPDDVAAIECDLNEAALGILIEREPGTGLEGKFNLPYCLAVAVHDGAAGLAQFSDERVADPSVRALARRVTLRPRPGEGGSRPEDWAAAVRVRLHDGTVRERAVTLRRGSFSGERLRRDERHEKFAACAARAGLSGARAREIAERLEALEELGDARDVAALLRPPA